MADRLGMPTVKIGGQRVTTPELLPIVAGVLSGPVNLRVVSACREAGLRPIGVSGASAGLVTAEPTGSQPGSLGLVGEPVEVDRELIDSLLDLGLTPVIAPLALARDGSTLNVNADLMASAIAEALQVDLVLVTDVEAVLDSLGKPISSLTTSEAQELIRAGVATGGMVPKIRGALRALAGGARSVWIGSINSAVGPSRGTRFTSAPVHIPILPEQSLGRAES